MTIGNRDMTQFGDSISVMCRLNFVDTTKPTSVALHTEKSNGQAKNNVLLIVKLRANQRNKVLESITGFK